MKNKVTNYYESLMRRLINNISLKKDKNILSEKKNKKLKQVEKRYYSKIPIENDKGEKEYYYYNFSNDNNRKEFTKWFKLDPKDKLKNRKGMKSWEIITKRIKADKTKYSEASYNEYKERYDRFATALAAEIEKKKLEKAAAKKVKDAARQQKSKELYNLEILDQNTGTPRQNFEKLKSSGVDMSELVPACIHTTNRANLLAPTYTVQKYRSFKKNRDGKPLYVKDRNANPPGKAFEWCGYFVAYLAGIKGNRDEARKYASTTMLNEHFKSKIVKDKNTIQEGDVATVNRSINSANQYGNHIVYIDEVVRDRNNKIISIVTLEGNTNGRTIARKTRKLKDVVFLYRGIMPNFDYSEVKQDDKELKGEIKKATFNISEVVNSSYTIWGGWDGLDVFNKEVPISHRGKQRYMFIKGGPGSTVRNTFISIYDNPGNSEEIAKNRVSLEISNFLGTKFTADEFVITKATYTMMGGNNSYITLEGDTPEDIGREFATWMGIGAQVKGFNWIVNKTIRKWGTFLFGRVFLWQWVAKYIFDDLRAYTDIKITIGGGSNQESIMKVDENIAGFCKFFGITPGALSGKISTLDEFFDEIDKVNKSKPNKRRQEELETIGTAKYSYIGIGFQRFGKDNEHSIPYPKTVRKEHIPPAYGRSTKLVIQAYQNYMLRTNMIGVGDWKIPFTETWTWKYTEESYLEFWKSIKRPLYKWALGYNFGKTYLHITKRYTLSKYEKGITKDINSLINDPKRRVKSIKAGHVNVDPYRMKNAEFKKLKGNFEKEEGKEINDSDLKSYLKFYHYEYDRKKEDKGFQTYLKENYPNMYKENNNEICTVINYKDSEKTRKRLQLIEAGIVRPFISEADMLDINRDQIYTYQKNYDIKYKKDWKEYHKRKYPHMYKELKKGKIDKTDKENSKIWKEEINFWPWGDDTNEENVESSTTKSNKSGKKRKKRNNKNNRNIKVVKKPPVGKSTAEKISDTDIDDLDFTQ